MIDTNHCVKLTALFTSSIYKLYMVDIVEFTNGETFFECVGPVSFNGTQIVRHVFWAVVVMQPPQGAQSQGWSNE